MNNSFFGVIGLGVMGKSISLNIADKGYSLSVYNRSEGDEARIVADFLAANTAYTNIQGFTRLEDFVHSLEKPRKVFLMIKAEQLLMLLSTRFFRSYLKVMLSLTAAIRISGIPHEDIICLKKSTSIL